MYVAPKANTVAIPFLVYAQHTHTKTTGAAAAGGAKDTVPFVPIFDLWTLAFNKQ